MMQKNSYELQSFSFQRMVQKHFNIGVNIGFILVGTLVLYGLNYKFRLFYLATPKPDVTVFTCEHGLAYCTDNKGCYEKAGRCMVYLIVGITQMNITVKVTYM